MKTVKIMGKLSIWETIKYNLPTRTKKFKSQAYKPERKSYNWKG